ncbi:hypothetical protein KAK07_11125 [Ideonella sp. 4Y16]|uniref:hypothetical protein n=1 Tax=Ideonella alba TaxID=2824118 RepID=UPI001B382E1B|nr:hypothetical protein [Ideonella alba]MBQ0943885.1 hypothetical protein [Ideonella alba]
MRALTAAVLLLAACAASAQDRADMDPSRIVGNRELPKVIYIVPWKKPLPDALQGKPPTSLVDEVLAPLDRDVHKRRLRFANESNPTAQPTANESPR